MRLYVSPALGVLVLAFALAGTSFPQPKVTAVANPNQQFGVTITPSSVTVKVGNKVYVNVTLTNPADGGLVCFSLEGFPDSGFQTSFSAECAIPQATGIVTVLTVEATPAAAPQSFTAFVIAKIGSQTAQAPLDVTVVPAMPAWIPWLGLLLFFVLIGVAVVWKPKLPFREARSHVRKT